jgi:hypothetical protein
MCLLGVVFGDVIDLDGFCGLLFFQNAAVFAVVVLCDCVRE